MEKLEMLIEKICGENKNRCECRAIGEIGQTDFIPIESTKIVCEMKIYPW